MIRFFLFVSSILLAVFTLFLGKGTFLDSDKAPPAISDVGKDATTGVNLKISKESATTTPPKKIAPILPVPAKSIKPISPPKIVPKVTEPLVHYTQQEKTPNALLSSEVVAWTNIYREQNKLKALTRNQMLDAAAIIKVHDMFNRQYFEHVSPTGKNSADLVTGVGYDYLWVGENLALGIFSDEKDLVDAWMASPGHRANILNAHFEEIGVGVDEGVYEGKHVWMAVQEFGKPSSSCPAPKAAVKTEIERNRKTIEELSTQANLLISEIHALKNNNDPTAYNQKVSEYNAVVAELNPLVQNAKSLVDMYNKEINEYNSCIGS